MKKALLAVCFLCVISVWLTGCGGQTDLMKKRPLEKVIISEPGSSDTWTQYDLSILEAFQGVIDRAEKESTLMDMSAPEYEVQIEDKWGRYQTIVIWIGEKGEKSALAVKGNSSTVYTVSEEDTKILHQLIVYLYE